MAGVIKKPKDPKEIDVFNHYSAGNKLKTILIALAIAVVSFVAIFFFVKSVITYTVTYVADGGLVYEEELKPSQYHFLQKTQRPAHLKKEGFYIEGYYTDKNFTNRYTFGTRIWNSFTLYVKWNPGYAVQLFFAEGEEEKSEMTEKQLKLYHEEYVEPDSEYTLPLVFNNIDEDIHKGEQLFWYVEDPECKTQPIQTQNFKVSHNIKLYGKWFETREDRYDVENGVLKRYLGNCDKLVLPSSVKKIKEIEPTKFEGKMWDTTKVADGSNYSAFDRVLDKVLIIYVNKECEELGSCSFKDLVNLTNVYFLGNKVKNIGDQAFDCCINLTSITLPSSVETIGHSAFRQCGSAIKSFVFLGAEGVTSIGETAFANTYITNIRFKNIQFIGGGAFSTCLKLESLTLEYAGVVDTNVASAGINILTTSDKCKIYVPEAYVDDYKATYPWSVYSQRISKIA